MGVSCLVRGKLSGFGVQARKHVAGVFVTLLPGAPALAGVKRYSRDTDKHGPEQFVCFQLPHRAVLKVQGPETSPFLQGLQTNDVTLLEEPGQAAMYAHMLNVQGRTLYDVLLYR